MAEVTDRSITSTPLRACRSLYSTKMFLECVGDCSLDRLLPKNHGKLVLQFPYTSMTMNNDYGARRHRDAHNDGPSVLMALGDCTDCLLKHWCNDDGKVPLKERTYPFLRMTTVNL